MTSLSPNSAAFSHSHIWAYHISLPACSSLSLGFEDIQWLQVSSILWLLSSPSLPYIGQFCGSIHLWSSSLSMLSPEQYHPTLLHSVILITSHYGLLALVIHSALDSSPNVPTGHVHFMSDILYLELNASSWSHYLSSQTGPFSYCPVS